jgi:hypothetical protein
MHKNCRSLASAWVLAASLTLLARKAEAQSELATLQGVVTGPNQTPVPGVLVTARDLNAGTVRTARTGSDGFYFIGGIIPSEYALRVVAIGFQPQVDTVRIRVATNPRLDFQLSAATAELAEVEISASRNAGTELRDPSIGSDVSVEQIDNLPNTDRNFLNLAQLAPGVQQPIPGNTQKTFGSGAATLDQSNVYIDGASYKNDILNGGIAGQTTNRGNPFPENAVQEFRVLTNNFKAEYQYSTSGLIEATTKSGGNEWHGSIFGYGEAPWMIRRDYTSTLAGQSPQDYKRLQDGFDLGGPIIKDKLHIFVSYEGNYQNFASRIIPGTDTTVSARALNAQQYAGTQIQQFRQGLYFGKLTYDITPEQHLEFSQTFNHNTDPGGYGNINGNQQAVHANGTNLINDVDNTTIRHTWSPGHWLNEAELGSQYVKWNQNPITTNQVSQTYQGVIVLGSAPTYQNFDQNRYSFHDNLTYSGFHGLGDHVFKAGVSYNYDHYHIWKEQDYNPNFNYNPDVSTTVPISANFGFGNPNLSNDNGEVGVFLQDDWTVTRRLTLNLGIRWDYESNELANSYISPRSQEDSLLAIRDSHGNQMISSRYFNNGGQRPPFTGEWQPRASLTYDITGKGRTIFVGNWGIFYDRDNYYYMSNEAYDRQWANSTIQFVPPGTTPGPGQVVWNPSYLSRQGIQSLAQQGKAPGQVYLNPDDLRPPWSTNFSLGLRQSVGQYVLSGTYVGSRGFNGFVYVWGNKDWTTGNFCYDSKCGQTPATFSQVLLGCGCIDSWYDAMVLKAEKPLTSRTRWGGWVAYTLSWAYQDGGNDIYALDRPRPSSYPRHPTGTDQRSVLQGNGTVRLPFDFVASAVVTFSSGSAYNQTNCQIYDSPIYGCYTQYNTFYVPKHDFLGISNAFAYYQDDLRVQKFFQTFSQQRVGLLVDVFNVFNLANRACPNTFTGTGGPQADYGGLTCSGFNNEGRTFQFGVIYDF